MRLSYLDPGTTVDREIIERMAGFGIDCRELPEEIINGDFSSRTAIYRQLRRRKITEQMKDLLEEMKKLTAPRGLVGYPMQSPEAVARDQLMAGQGLLRRPVPRMYMAGSERVGAVMTRLKEQKLNGGNPPGRGFVRRVSKGMAIREDLSQGSERRPSLEAP
jgi:hypothetical protein